MRFKALTQTRKINQVRLMLGKTFTIGELRERLKANKAMHSVEFIKSLVRYKALDYDNGLFSFNGPVYWKRVHNAHNDYREQKTGIRIPLKEWRSALC